MKKTNSILMIRPFNFQFNNQTAIDNHYQNQNDSLKDAHKKAEKEFDKMVSELRKNGISVFVFNDDGKFHTPDSIFPNNWISFHENGNIGLYPMFAKNRRLERRPEILKYLNAQGFLTKEIIDYSAAEKSGKYLEGTGSMILDRENRIAYCSLSKRSNEGLFYTFCEDFKFKPLVFKSYQSINEKRLSIYHTNVMMCVASEYAVICLDSVDNIHEKKRLVETIIQSGKEIIEIQENQVEKFAGNMLELKNSTGDSVLVMSSAARNCLNDKQIKSILKHSKIINSDLDTIESLGGGSARCMIAEIFLPQAST